ncbi:archaeal conserved hypothetical protein [Thermoplasmatales archaeon BRNA1]|nr:archaeal conserved hypothetical protein [Thermoplasmatales archaeon BRNA1]
MSGKMLSGTLKELELIERHLMMLKAIKANQPVGIIRLSELTGIPQHKVRYSLRLLERDGLIMATQDGAKITDRYGDFTRELAESLDKAISVAEGIRDRASKE